MKKVLAFVLALVMVLSMAACGNDANKQGDAEKEVTKIRLAHDYSPETANSIGMENFAKLVAEKSGGTIEIDIYSNGELSGRNSQTTFKLLQSGDIDMAIVPPPNTDAWQLFYQPFFFRDSDSAYAACQGEAGQMMLDKLRDSNNVVGLAYLPIAMRAFTNSKHPIQAPADMEGLNFRVLDVPTLVTWMKEFKASAVPMSMAELYMSLQNGTVDGQENPLDTIKNQAFYEVQEYLSITNHIWSFSLFAVNADFWDKLTTEQQDILKECAVEASKDIKELAPEVNDAAYDFLVNEKGMKVNTLTEEQWLEFQKAAKPVCAYSSHGSKLQRLAFGDERLVRFSYFLFDEYFPLHDELVAREGKLIKGALESGSKDYSEIAEAAKAVEGLYESMLG